MSQQPPAFQESSKCAFCAHAFGMMRRRHHCRNCGKSVCDKCTGESIPLPKFGLVEPVRVCLYCHKDGAGRGGASTTKAAPVEKEEHIPTYIPVEKPPPAPKVVKNCTCGMPLCICEPDPESEEEEEVEEVKKPVVKPTSPSKPAAFLGGASSFHGFGGSSSKKTYDLSGNLEDQCREAIKDKDVDGVKSLLAAKADASFTDKTGNALIHLAAMFNSETIVKLLVDNGANVWAKNPSGETAVDLAPTALGFTMKDWQPKP